DDPILVRDEPRRIPAEPDAVTKTGEIAVGRETQLLKSLETGFCDGTRRGARLDRGDAGLDRGDRGLERFDLGMGGVADRLGTRMIEIITLEHTGQADAEPMAILKRFLGGEGLEIGRDIERRIAATSRRHEIVVHDGSLTSEGVQSYPHDLAMGDPRP